MTTIQKMKIRDWVKKYDVLLATLAFLIIITILIVLEHKQII